MIERDRIRWTRRARRRGQISDQTAMDRIRWLLDCSEWSSDTAPAVAEIVRLTGRTIDEPTECEQGCC